MTLLECLHNALFVHNCNHGEEAGVRCTGNVDSSESSGNECKHQSLNTTTISTHGIIIHHLNHLKVALKTVNSNTMIQHQPSSFQVGWFKQ